MRSWPFLVTLPIVGLSIATGAFAQSGSQVGPQDLVLHPSERIEPEEGTPSTASSTKWYVVTRDNIVYCEQPGMHPATGRECRPVTPEVMERIQAYKWGNRPKQIEASDPTFFSLRTGEPVVWYHRTQDGTIRLFDLMGFDPETGDELLPITKEVVALWKAQETERKKEVDWKKQEEARRAPQLVDPNKYGPFDPLSGKPRVWYSRTTDGKYQFYDGPGYDPRTGEALALITGDILDDWHRSLQLSQKCYIITRDSRTPVLYRESAPGTDSLTGRQCRLVTPDLLERLREYETGKRPGRVEAREPTFFDPRTGEPVLWYTKNGRGDIELFDLMGFHPESGDELLPVNKPISEIWKEQQTRRPPKRIDVEKSELFDLLTGEPRVWYWHGDQGEYEFYDNAGFHPRTGEPLISLTRDAAAKMLKEVEEREKRLHAERQKRDEEARKQAELRERQQQARKAEQEQEERKRQLQREQEDHAAKACDELAANPTDPNRVGPGVPYEALKEQAEEALKNCEMAAKQSPNELRFQYQRARALQQLDRDKALTLFKKLVQTRYPAAFDNVGWLYITQRRDFAEAVRHFRMGAQLGDPDSMVSLVEMYDRGYATPRNANETKIALWQRAAEMGHPKALRALEVEHQNAVEVDRQRAIQEQQARRMIQFFGAVIGGARGFGLGR